MSEQQEWTPKYNPWLIAIAVMSATFMEVLDTSIANVALPQIAGSTAATTEEATWAITSYLVANAIVLPLTGWLGVTFGRKRFLMACVVAFTIASALSGAATSLGQLIFFRVLQGLGGGAMQPVAQSVLLESFPPAKRGAAMAFYGVGIVVAPILGPIVGGWFTDNYSWRWCFYINVPVGVIALLLIGIVLEDPPYLKQQQSRKVDYWGFLFLALWVSGLQIALDKGQQEDWLESSLIVGLLATFVVFLMLFIWRELTANEPIVDLTVFRDRTFALSTVLITLVGAVLYGSVTLSPLFLQQLLRYPSFDAGLAVAPRGMGAMAAMMAVGPLLARFDGRYFVALGFTLLGLSNFWLGSQLNTGIGIEHIAWPNVLNGVAIGLIFVPLVTIANDKLPKDKLGQAAGLFNLMRNLGGGVGIAISTTLISRGTQAHQNFLSAHVNIYNPNYQAAREHLQQVTGAHDVTALLAAILGQQSAILAYIDTFTIMGIICLSCMPLIFFLAKPTGGGPGPGAMH